MDTKLTILLHGKKNIASDNQMLTIYLRITINGKRLEISTHRQIELSRWCSEKEKVKGNSEESRNLNAWLETLKQKVYTYQHELFQEGKPCGVEALRQKWYGTDEKSVSLVQIFQEHNARLKQLIGIDCARATYGKFNTSLDHLVNFLKWKDRVPDINVRDIQYSTITDFEFWLKSEKKCNHNTTIKHLSNFKKIVGICLRNGWISKDPFLGYKMTKKEVVRDFLSENELQRIRDRDFGNQRLNQVRDIFLFSCFTGLAYIDAKRLKRSDIVIGVDNEKWIFTKRKKTDTPSRIPLLPTVLELIANYESHPQCVAENCLLPIPSNQKLNAYLKEIATITHITKCLTFHVARHTFATTITLNNGVPIETVSKMLGHKSIKITQHYAKILDRKVSDDMQALRKKFPKQTGSETSTATLTDLQ